MKPLFEEINEGNCEEVWNFLHNQGWLTVHAKGSEGEEGIFLGFWHLEITGPQNRFMTMQQALNETNRIFAATA